MRLIFTLGTSQPQRVYSRNFFLSIGRVHRALWLKTVKLWVVSLKTTWRPLTKGKTQKLMDNKERTELKNSRAKQGEMLGGPQGYG